MQRPAKDGDEQQGLPERLASQRRQTVMLTIENAALDLLAKHKMSDVTVEEIADRAGVGLRTLYRYFPNKYAILAAYPHRGAAILADRIKGRPPEETPFEALRNGIAETYENMDPVENNRWLAAIANSTSADRPALTALRVTADAMSEALADRMGVSPDDLWPAIAGTMAAAAMQAGTRRWFAHQGDYVQCILDALDVAGSGLERMQPATIPEPRTGRLRDGKGGTRSQAR